MGTIYNIDSQVELVHAIKINDPVALKSLYNSNYHNIESLVLQNKGTKEHAKDIYQEAFVTVWKNVKTAAFVPQNKTALQGYLYQIAKNKWMDVLRSSQFKKTNLIKNDFALEISLEESPDVFQQEAQFSQQLKLTMDAFKALSDPCKSLLKTFYFEKKSLRDIAQTLQIEETTVRNKKYRCMEKLRQMVNASNP